MWRDICEQGEETDDREEPGRPVPNDRETEYEQAQRGPAAAGADADGEAVVLAPRAPRRGVGFGVGVAEEFAFFDDGGEAVGDAARAAEGGVRADVDIVRWCGCAAGWASDGHGDTIPSAGGCGRGPAGLCRGLCGLGLRRIIGRTESVH